MCLSLPFSDGLEPVELIKSFLNYVHNSHKSKVELRLKSVNSLELNYTDLSLQVHIDIEPPFRKINWTNCQGRGAQGDFPKCNG